MEDTKNMRYIVMMLTPATQQYLSDGRRIDTHDGDIFCSLEDAKQYALDAITKKLCTRFAIGRFVIDMEVERMGISVVETFGFRNDKKNIEQLSIF